MNKILTKILSFLEILIVVIFFVINYFTESRMGMMRHVVYRNEYWSSVFNPNTIALFNVIIIGVLMINLLYIKKYGIKKSVEEIFSVIVLFIASNCINIFNVDKLTTYYYMLICIVVIFAIEIAKIITKIMKS